LTEPPVTHRARRALQVPLLNSEARGRLDLANRRVPYSLDFFLELGVHEASIRRSPSGDKCAARRAACEWTHIVCATLGSGVP
jgi:hypothetical protein